jgi:hypothetical protein
MPFNVSDPIAKRYARALCHLNQARRTHRLGLVLGSGISDDLGIPKWKLLIDQIAQKLSYDSGGAPESYRAEQLYQHYKRKRSDELGWANNERLDAAILAGWRETVAGCLYASFRKKSRPNFASYRDKIKNHPYLGALGKLARTAQLVVTHNFDDALEVAIDMDPTASAEPNRRYHSFWRPEPFLRRGMVNIYHPNGFTPLSSGLSGSTGRYLARQRERLAKIYKKAIDAGGLVQTDRCTVAVSVKAAARIIHFGAYTPFDFANRLRVLQKGT